MLINIMTVFFMMALFMTSAAAWMNSSYLVVNPFEKNARVSSPENPVKNGSAYYMTDRMGRRIVACDFNGRCEYVIDAGNFTTFDRIRMIAADSKGQLIVRKISSARGFDEIGFVDREGNFLENFGAIRRDSSTGADFLQCFDDRIYFFSEAGDAVDLNELFFDTRLKKVHINIQPKEFISIAVKSLSDFILLGKNGEIHVYSDGKVRKDFSNSSGLLSNPQMVCVSGKNSYYILDSSKRIYSYIPGSSPVLYHEAGKNNAPDFTLSGISSDGDGNICAIDTPSGRLVTFSGKSVHVSSDYVVAGQAKKERLLVWINMVFVAVSACGLAVIALIHRSQKKKHRLIY